MNISRTAIFLLLGAFFASTAAVPSEPVLVLEHWPDGTLKLRKHVLTLPDGSTVDHGEFRRWHDNGNLEYEAVFVRGLKEGTTVRYHRNGRPANRQEYRKGLRHGPSLSWNPAGEKVKEENWAEGRPHGVWTVWKDGKVQWTAAFTHGKPVSPGETETKGQHP